ncbi:MAG: nicotinamide riboside transporter PnuC [Tannerellaceae bacterium]|nr:nicotinamide riboside transporter PnuC [Tannerellaceae bacterium]
MDIIEIIGAAVALFYVLLQVKQHPWMWIVGFVSALFYVWIFFSSAFYANMSLQMYYVVASVYGFWMWRYRNAPQESGIIVYKHLSAKLAALLAPIILLTALGAYYVLSRHTDSQFPIGDAFTTAAGFVATWMLAHKIIEHWLLWIVADSIAIYLYYSAGLYPTMVLYFCYVILAVAGYYTWRTKGVTSVQAAEKRSY